jgi:FlaA1/EpsC-like NDP-sugar epimerase
VVIYGAGEAGAELAIALMAGRTYQPVAYVDEKRSLIGTLIHGVPVVPPEEVHAAVRTEGVRTILLAIPTASRVRRSEVIRELESLGVRVQSVPDLEDIAAGRARVDDLRDVDVADLLGRDPVPPNKRLLDACIRGKNVLVTGGGGSIGSELCRQILRLAPRRLCVLEMSEHALYQIERELRQMADGAGLQVEIVALLGSAHHRARMRDVMRSFAVQTVYHAAAYKHVPIVEHNMIEGIHNNLISTWYTAEAAVECGVETFVLISTDKAVNPTNVMGATKRLAEMVLQGMQRRAGGRTRFCMVRFGNVLESSGSVVPLFREQIRRGGPVTVTHPEIVRYFMMIPEAAQLVLQAGSMGLGGDVFVLDMGQPVRIQDLARRMVQLSGLTVKDDKNPDGDIEIRFTGLRPAEKLYEELLIGKNVTGTEHPMIMRAVEHSLPWDDMEQILAELMGVLDQFDCAAASALLHRAVVEYQSADGVQDLVWSRSAAAAQTVHPSVVNVSDYARLR